MTEKQKMLLGIIYNAEDKTLIEERNHAKELTYNYNQTRPGQKQERKDLAKEIFGQCGDQVHIEPPIYLDYGYLVEIGSNFFSNYNLTIVDGGGVSIGEHVFIGPNVGIYTAAHPVDERRRDLGLEWGIPITIGNHVWIGGGVQIMPGVTIGDHVTIGAGSVVTKDIPSNCVAVGNPCKVIRDI